MLMDNSWNSTLNRRTSTSLIPRAQQYIWCVHGTKTYVTMKMAQTLASEAALALVNDAYNSVYAHLMTAGDGLLPKGKWSYKDPLLLLSVMNSNNHQMTWGVLASAIWGMKDFMTAENIYACNHFWVYDGINLIGMGRIAFNRGSGGQG